MNTPKHTAGPWRVTQDSAYTLDVCKTDGDIRSRIARLHVELLAEEHGGCIAGNASLIAAAPDLLAALEAAVAYLEANRPKGNIRKIFSTLNQYENEVMKPARLAISKATGVQS